MNKRNLLKKALTFGVILLFCCGAIAPCISVVSKEIETLETIKNQDETVVTCYVFGKKYNSECEVVLSSDDFERFYSIFKDLNYMISYKPFSSETKDLKVEFVDLLDSLGLIPEDSSKDDVISLINPFVGRRRPLFFLLPSPIYGPRGSAFFCNFATLGEGSQFPVIILPRLIPILLFPIPRVIMRWNAIYGVTSCGGLLSGKGFIAEGAQQGTALGFWGIGFSVFLPPVMSFGFIGYALFATATAEMINSWPPNSAPIISQENPTSGKLDVPISLSELSFRIEDTDNNRMSYRVTTDPDIGSGQGFNKKDGVYSVSVNGLDNDKLYSWTVRVTDGTETVEKRFGFITEAGPPFNPFDEGWQYRKKITIDRNMVDGDLSDFPVLFSIVDTDLRDKAQVDGVDILFMNGSGIAKKLYHEIEKYDSSSGELVAWVKVDSLSGLSDTDFFMYYGNSGCSNQQFPEKVWNINYVMVQHMNDKTISSIEDSTIYNNDGTKIGNNEPIENLAKIGYGQDFDAVNDYIRIPDSDPISVGAGDLTISAWIKPRSEEITVLSKVQGGHNKEYFLYTKPEQQIRYMIENWYDDNNHYTTTTSPINFNEWQHIAVTFDADTYGTKIYHNGITQDITGSIDELPKMLDDDLTIGIYGGDLMEKHFDGIIDEVRISKITINTDWISTEYKNQNDPLSFFIIGPEESVQ